jgi:hypothetical protein
LSSEKPPNKLSVLSRQRILIVECNQRTIAAVFEAVTGNPLRDSIVDLKLVPDPVAGSRKNVPLDFSLAPLIRMAVRVVNSVIGEPVAGVRCLRSEIFTSLAGSSALTVKDGRFELEIPGPLRILWFWVDRDGFAENRAVPT